MLSTTASYVFSCSHAGTWFPRRREPALADIYAGRSSAPAAPFRHLCLEHSRPSSSVNSRTVQTNEVGRSALLGPALTWAAGGEPVQLVDVGCSAGLNLLCDRYRLDYGGHGVSGPDDLRSGSIAEVVAGSPPVPPRPPVISGRVGIDLDPPDLTDPDDTRWLLACIWPGTGRFQRAAQAIELGRADPPPVLKWRRGGEVPEVLAGLGEGRVVVVNSWSFAYFSVEQRQTYVDLLAEVGRSRPVVWLNMDAPGVVELLAGAAPPAGSLEKLTC